jgi:transposase
MYEYRQVIVRMRLGESDRAIARTGLMGRKKVQAVRELATDRGWLDPAADLPEDAELATHFPTTAPRPQATSLVEPYATEVKAWRGKGIQGTTIHQALVRKHGFTGSYSSVRRYLQGVEAANPQATTVLDFEPGEVAQVDFGAGPEITDVHTGETFKTWVFVMVLAWSRHQYAELVRDQTVATWLGCHRRAFEWFGGVVSRVTIDNPKCAITKACYHDPQVQRAYAECAEGYGFLINALPPREPKKKGRVEAGVKYVKANFFPLREFRSLGDANRQLQAWVMGTAGNRIHGTTHEKPLTRFIETERHLLQSLPDSPPELASWAKVKLHGDCHVQFEKCRYSAPYRLVGQSLWLRASETTVRLFQHQEMIAIHTRLVGPGKRSTVPEHLPPEALAYSMQDPQWCLRQAEAIGPACHALIEQLFADRVLDNLRAAQGVIKLGERFGTTRLEAAATRALAYDSPRYRTVKTMLENGIDQQPLDNGGCDPLGRAYTGGGRFSRNTKDLLTH